MDVVWHMRQKHQTDVLCDLGRCIGHPFWGYWSRLRHDLGPHVGHQFWDMDLVWDKGTASERGESSMPPFRMRTSANTHGAAEQERKKKQSSRSGNGSYKGRRIQAAFQLDPRLSFSKKNSYFFFCCRCFFGFFFSLGFCSLCTAADAASFVFQQASRGIWLQRSTKHFAGGATSADGGRRCVGGSQCRSCWCSGCARSGIGVVWMRAARGFESYCGGVFVKHWG